MRRELAQRGDALVRALTSNGGEVEFDQLEPGGIFGRVIPLEAGGQGPRLGGGQVLVEDGVGVEVVLYEHDFFGLGVGGR